MMTKLLGRCGAIDILVNNAVVRHFAAVENFSPDDWDRALAVNLSAPFHLIRLALPSMKQRNWGRIVNMASIYSTRAVEDRNRLRHHENGNPWPHPRCRAGNSAHRHYLQCNRSRHPSNTRHPGQDRVPGGKGRRKHRELHGQSTSRRASPPAVSSEWNPSAPSSPFSAALPRRTSREPACRSTEAGPSHKPDTSGKKCRQ